MNRPPFPRQSPPQPSGPVPPGLQTLRGIVGRFTYQNEEGFSIARFVAETAGGGLKAKEEVVLTGSLPGVEAGASLEVTGEWVRNPKFGIQFALQSFRPIPPSSVEGIRAFLGSGLIAGIGKEYAGRIVGQFSEKTLEIIDREPERLLEVEGIGPKRFERIVTSWKEHRDVADIMQFLQSYGISSTWATRIYKIYGSEAVNVLTKNPYRLAIDIRGIGFKSADKIALKAGMAHDAPERVQAGVLHLLREAAGDGHTFFPFDELSVQALEILGIEDPVRIRQATSELCKPEMSAKGPWWWPRNCPKATRRSICGDCTTPKPGSQPMWPPCARPARRCRNSIFRRNWPFCSGKAVSNWRGNRLRPSGWPCAGG
jgi:exodeoxyribonuclease V alpha subunit